MYNNGGHTPINGFNNWAPVNVNPPLDLDSMARLRNLNRNNEVIPIPQPPADINPEVGPNHNGPPAENQEDSNIRRLAFVTDKPTYMIVDDNIINRKTLSGLISQEIEGANFNGVDNG